MVIWGVQDGVPGLSVLSNLFQPTGCKKSKYSTVIVPKFSDSPDQTLRKSCTASWQKPQEEASLHFHMNGKWPLPQAKILSNILSGTTSLSMRQRPALQQDYWMTPSHEWPQTIKRLNPAYTKDWMELITSSSAYPGPTIPLSHIGRTAHTPGLYCSPSIQTPRQTWPHRRLAASLDEWKCLLQILWNWWSLFFLQIKVSTSSVYY